VITTRAVRIVTLLAAGNIALSLLLRVWYRDGFIPGWDLMGAAEGVRLLATLTPSELLDYYRRFHGDLVLWWNVYGAPVTLLPGVLTNLQPWLYWAHVSTFVCTALMAVLAARAIPSGGRAAGLLALGASPTVLSWSIAGFPYISAAWPYALALWGVLRLRGFFSSLVVAVLACELSWHGQELGRTVFLVYALAAVGAVPARWYVRVVWLAVAGAQAAYATMHPTLNTARWSARPSLMTLVDVVPSMLDEIVFGRHFGNPPDSPFIFALAVVAALLVRTNRWLWRGLLAVHAGLLTWLCANAGAGGGALWPRRVLLLSALSILTIAVAAADRARWRPLLLGALLLGNVWQLHETIEWARSPASPRDGFRYTLPYAHANLDYYVPTFVTPWADRILADIEAGRSVVLLYNLGSYWENNTDPTGIPEWLYVTLGHRRFTERVFMFGSQTVRHHQVPVRPLAELDRVVNAIEHPQDIIVHGLKSPLDSPGTVSELDTIRAALEKRFQLVPVPAGQPSRPFVVWERFTLAPRGG
jgi:hypothetical protein